MTASRVRIPGSLQFRLVVGFTLILAGALASLAIFSVYATRNETERYAAAVEAAQAERAEQAVADAYEGDQNWDAVQIAVEQVSALFDWRVVIASLDGSVLADSDRNLWDENPGRLDIMRPSYWRPVLVDNQIVGVMWVEGSPRGRFSPQSFQQPGMPVGEQYAREGDMVIVRTESGRHQIVSASEGMQIQAEAADAANTEAALEEAILAEPSLSRLEAAFQNSVIWTGLIAGGIGVVLVALFTRQALAPVRTLTSAAHRIGRGDLSHRVPVNNRRDEVGELSQTFNLMAEGLQLAEDRRKKMTADIAHELRTPLTNIQGYLEAMRDGVVEADTETLTTLHLQATHLSRLVDDLRLLSVAEAGALQLELNEDDVASLVIETARAFQPRASAANVDLQVELANGLPSVKVDRGRMRQVVGNLVENALAYTPTGGRIDVRSLRSEGGGVRIEVCDSGPGIPGGEIDRIFEQFYRIDSSRSRATGGAGLGLTIVRRLVEAHGGTVRAESRPGHGAVFIVELPSSESRE